TSRDATLAPPRAARLPRRRRKNQNFERTVLAAAMLWTALQRVVGNVSGYGRSALGADVDRSGLRLGALIRRHHRFTDPRLVRNLAEFRGGVGSVEEGEAPEGLSVVAQDDFAVANLLDVVVAQKRIFVEEQTLSHEETGDAEGVDPSDLISLVRADYHSNLQLFRIYHRLSLAQLAITDLWPRKR